MFDMEIGEVYSVNQEVPEHGETPKKTLEKFMTSEDVTLLLHSPDATGNECRIDLLALPLFRKKLANRPK